MTAAPVNETTRPGGNRNGSGTNTEESHLMSDRNPTAPIECAVAVAGMLRLPDTPTLLGAPAWAATSAVVAEEVAHVYRAPVTVGVLTDSESTPVQQCTVTLSQTDYLRIEDHQVVGTDRAPAEITLAAPTDYVSWPIDQARVMHAVLGALLARHDAAGGAR